MPADTCFPGSAHETHLDCRHCLACLGTGAHLRYADACDSCHGTGIAYCACGAIAGRAADDDGEVRCSKCSVAHDHSFCWECGDAPATSMRESGHGVCERCAGCHGPTEPVTGAHLAVA